MATAALIAALGQFTVDAYVEKPAWAACCTW